MHPYYDICVFRTYQRYLQRNYPRKRVCPCSETDIKIKINDNSITLAGADNNNIIIYNINGLLIKSIEQYTGEEITLDEGIYIVRIGNNAIKIKI